WSEPHVEDDGDDPWTRLAARSACGGPERGGRAAGHAWPPELKPFLPAWLLAIATLVAAGRPAAAQTPVPLTCDGLTVSSIEFASRDPSLTSLPSQLQGVARVVGLIHTTTDPGVLRHFLHLEVGEPCTELRRAESERTLRVQPYLADVMVRAVPDGSGGVRIEVETID